MRVLIASDVRSPVLDDISPTITVFCARVGYCCIRYSAGWHVCVCVNRAILQAVGQAHCNLSTHHSAIPPFVRRISEEEAAIRETALEDAKEEAVQQQAKAVANVRRIPAGGISFTSAQVSTHGNRGPIPPVTRVIAPPLTNMLSWESTFGSIISVLEKETQNKYV